MLLVWCGYRWHIGVFIWGFLLMCRLQFPLFFLIFYHVYVHVHVDGYIYVYVYVYVLCPSSVTSSMSYVSF